LNNDDEKQGIKYRFRVINITGLGPDLNFSLLYDKTPVNWRMIAKDGADLPTQQRLVKSANTQPVTIGETRDFEFQPDKTGIYSFEVRRGGGYLVITTVIQVK